jgi:hypothetical protein
MVMRVSLLKIFGLVPFMLSRLSHRLQIRLMVTAAHDLIILGARYYEF